MVRMLQMWLALVSLCLPWCEVATYPSGAPTARCTDMQPDVTSHGGPAQSSTPPYNLTVNSREIQSGGSVTVTLDSATVDFRGLLLQVRQKDTTTIVGTFGTAPANFTLIACSGADSAVTHSDGSDKGLPQTFTWTAPGDVTGELEVVATIVQMKTVYWIQVKSASFAVTAADTTTVSGAAGLVPLSLTCIMVLLSMIISLM